MSLFRLRRRILLWTAWAAVLCAAASGCSRAFWRAQSDREVYRLTQEKLFDPRWDLPRTVITPDPRSRLFDPYDPDKGPLPPDDPAAHLFMHEVAGIRGSKSWHKMGRALSIENPHWLEPFGLVPVLDDLPMQDPLLPAPAQEFLDAPPRLLPPPPSPELNGASLPGRGPAVDPAAEPAAIAHVSHEERAESDIHPAGLEQPVPLDPYAPEHLAEIIGDDEPSRPRYRALKPGIEDLTLEQSLELSYIHSREYQTQLEDVYLAALDVSFERFQFQVRYLGAVGEPSGSLIHRILPRRPDELQATGRFGISQLLPTGAQWLVELSNQTIWLFAGENRTSTASVLSYAIVQPLLQGAGRKIVMENLTQSERNLLYAVRDLSQFRREFFSEVTAGFLELLQRQQVIRNQQDNIRRLEQQTEVLAALLEIPDELAEPLLELPPELGGLLLGTYVPVFGPLIVLPPPGLEFPPEVSDVIRYDARDRLLFLRSTVTEEQAQLLLDLSDAPAWQLAVRNLLQRMRTEVLNQDVLQLQTRLLRAQTGLRTAEQIYQDVLDRFKIGLGLPPDFQMTIDESLLEPLQLLDPQLIRLEDEIRGFVARPDWMAIDIERPQIERLESVRTGLEELLAEVLRSGMRLVEEDLERAEAHLSERLRDVPDSEEAERMRAALERDRFLFEEAQGELELLRGALGRLAIFLEEELTEDEKRQAYSQLAEIREDLLRAVPALAGIQIGLRVELVELNRFVIPMEEAVQIGLANRVDLMNERARVTDARRRVELAANQLQAVLNVVAEGELRTRPIRSRPFNTNPFDFRGRESEFRAGVRFTAPLDQIVERNNYRAALIAYQQARRQYMRFEDDVKFQIRSSHRVLTALERNFEVERQSMRISALQYDAAVEQAQRPARPGEQVDRGGGLAGLNLLLALDSVLAAQNAFIGTWVDYERARLNIHRDMGIMEIDARGVWDDPFYQNAARPEERTDAQEASPLTTVSAETAAVDVGGGVRAPLGVCRPVVPRAAGPHERGPRSRHEPGDRGGEAGALPHLGDGARHGRQLEEFDPHQPRRGIDDDHLHRPGGDARPSPGYR